MRILYGRGPGPPDEWGEPEIRFYQSGQDIETEFEGVSKVTVEEDKGVRWTDLMDPITKREWKGATPGQPQRANHILRNFCNDLKGNCHPKSGMERRFFDLFVGLTVNEAFTAPSAINPALLPNVWVNWYPDKDKRDRRKEPHLADFAVKHPQIEDGDLTIIEIDGRSHYTEYDEETEQYTLSQTKYATHLREDRFLRRIVPKVVRIGHAEIHNVRSNPGSDLSNFYDLWNRAFKSEAWIEKFEDVDPLP